MRLVDVYDNAIDGTVTCEVSFVDTLRIAAGAKLIDHTCRIECNTLVTSGVVDATENLILSRGPL